MSIIKNKEELATTPLRRDALEILEAGLEAIDTEKILRRKVSLKDGILDVGKESFNLQSFNKIIFIGIGKCALDGAKVIEDILGDYLTEGIAIDVIADSAKGFVAPKKVKYFAGTHPYPSEQNIEATRQILKMVSNLTEKDLVITLISGGGSSLFELPTIPLEELIEKTKELTARGADIYELNTFRKNVSQVKGGKFAESCLPAQVVSLLFSDVLGNDISIIASGPTVLEAPTERVKNILLVSNHDALEAMKVKAEELGFDTAIETEKLSGNAAEIGKELAQREPKPKTCILFGGETTVKLPAFAPKSELQRGEGGRNQEMALSVLSYMPEDSILVCAASDGHDNTDHAGAIADKQLLQKAKDLNLNPQEYLERSDSYNFFKNVGGAIYTGKLGSNVSDLCILIYK